MRRRAHERKREEREEERMRERERERERATNRVRKVSDAGKECRAHEPGGEGHAPSPYEKWKKSAAKFRYINIWCKKSLKRG